MIKNKCIYVHMAKSMKQKCIEAICGFTQSPKTHANEGEKQ